MIRIFTKDGQPLDEVRERAQMRYLWGERSEVIRDMTVSANGTGMLIDRTSGLYQINGIMIDDDAILTSWVDLDAIDSDNSVPRFFLVWATYNPATDALPSYGVTSSSDVLTYVAKLTDPHTLVLTAIFFDTGATNASQGTYVRPQLRYSFDDIFDMCAAAHILNVDAVKFEDIGSNQYAIKWVGMSLVSETLGRRFVIKGDPSTPISEAVGYSLTLTEQLVVTDSARTLLYARCPKAVGNVPPLDVEMFSVEVSTGGALTDFRQLASSSSSYALGSTSWPERAERESVRLLGVVADQRIFWINGSVTLLDRISYGRRGDTHTALGLSSTVYSTSEAPDPVTGTIDLDDIITNMAQLQNITLDTAYDGAAGSGSGNTINVDHGPISLLVDGPTSGDNPWRSGVIITQNALGSPDSRYLEAGVDVVDEPLALPSAWKNAIRHRRVAVIEDQVFNAITMLAQPADLIYQDSMVRVIFTTPDAPGYNQILNFQINSGGRLYVQLSGLPGGLTGDQFIYELVPNTTFANRFVLRTIDNAATVDIPNYDVNMLGSLGSTLSCQCTIWHATMELGAGQSFLRTNQLTITGNQLVTNKLESDDFEANTSDVAARTGGTLALTGGATIDGTVGLAETASPGVYALVVSPTEVLCQQNLVIGGIGAGDATAQRFRAFQKDRYQYLTSQTFTKAVSMAIHTNDGWSVDAGQKFSRPAGAAVTMSFAFVMPGNCALMALRARARVIDPAAVGGWAFSMSLARIEFGTGTNPVDTSAIHVISPAINGTWSTVAIVDTDPNMPAIVTEDTMWLVAFSGQNVEVGALVQAEFVTFELRY